MLNDFHHTQMGRRFFCHDFPTLAEGIQKVALELAIMNSRTKTKEGRYKELLNNVIDHFSAGESCHALIDKLLDIGFEPAELVHDFNFNAQDVEDRLLERAEEESSQED